MNRLPGPELYWLAVYGLLRLTGKFTGSPHVKMNAFWEASWYWIPLVLVPASFMVYYITGVPRSFMWLRLLVFGMIGAHFTLSYTLGLHTEQGPGIGTAYIIGLILSMIVIIAGTIWALIKF